MLETVRAVNFVKRMEWGRTRPSLIRIVDSQGAQIEVVTKYSAGCDRREIALVAEAIAAMLAEDLKLPIPRCYLVTLTPEFIQGIPDAEIKKLASESCSPCFGSRRLPLGTHGWIGGSVLPNNSLSDAAEIFAFDAAIDNVDRRIENTNLLLSGDRLWIYDHELAFAVELLVFGWKPPWVPGSRARLGVPPTQHVLADALRGKALDLDRYKTAWRTISDQRIQSYGASIPATWRGNGVALAKLLDLIRDIRENIDGCVEEVKRVLQ